MACLCHRDNPRALADAIVRVLRDDTLRACLIQKGFETLKRFDEDDCVMRIEALYAQTIAKNAAVQP